MTAAVNSLPLKTDEGFAVVPHLVHVQHRNNKFINNSDVGAEWRDLTPLLETNLELPWSGCANKNLSRDHNGVRLQQDLIRLRWPLDLYLHDDDACYLGARLHRLKDAISPQIIQFVRYKKIKNEQGRHCLVSIMRESLWFYFIILTFINLLSEGSGGSWGMSLRTKWQTLW